MTEVEHRKLAARVKRLEKQERVAWTARVAAKRKSKRTYTAFARADERWLRWQRRYKTARAELYPAYAEDGL